MSCFRLPLLAGADSWCTKLDSAFHQLVKEIRRAGPRSKPEEGRGSITLGAYLQVGRYPATLDNRWIDVACFVETFPYVAAIQAAHRRGVKAGAGVAWLAVAARQQFNSTTAGRGVCGS